MSKTRVLAAALELLDRNGLESLSMRKLAEKLGVEAMSLYKHVANKDALLDGVVDVVLSEIEIPPVTEKWREAMELRAESARRVILRHPWAAALIESRMTPGDIRFGYADSILGFLRRAGFSVELAYRAFLTIDSYVYGFTLQEINWPSEKSTQLRVAAAVRDFIPANKYPYLLEVMDYMASRWQRKVPDYDSDFSSGLGLILDSLERAAPRRKSTINGNLI